jgi:hypothetical protein
VAEYDVARVCQVLVLPQSRKVPPAVALERCFPCLKRLVERELEAAFTAATEQLERELAALRRECASLRELHAAAAERETASLH